MTLFNCSVLDGIRNCSEAFYEFLVRKILKLLPGVSGNKSSNTLVSGNSMVPAKFFFEQNMLIREVV